MDESLQGGPGSVSSGGLALDSQRAHYPRAPVDGNLPVFQVPILIPCHRVVRSSGAMGNYSGGVAVKEWLLAHEGSLVGKLAMEGPPVQPEPQPAGRN